MIELVNFLSRYLANDMEEDEEDDKYEIFCWAVGKGWMKEYPKLLNNRDRLWKKMQFRAVVSKKTCEEVCHYCGRGWTIML